MTDENVLETMVLDHHEWWGLKQLSNAMSDLEPLAKRARLGPVIADRLVALTLAEKGEATERYVGIRKAIALPNRVGQCLSGVDFLGRAAASRQGAHLENRTEPKQ